MIPAIVYRWLAVAALVAAACAVSWFKGEMHGEAKLTAYQLAESQATVRAQAAAAAITQQRQHQKDEALNAANERAKIAQAAADSAHAVGDSLRRDLAGTELVSRASIGSLRAYTTTLRAVFGECTAEVERLAAAADGHASDSLTYQQAWPK